MTTQLRLIDPTEIDWRLDERTRAIGRHGLAKAREALRAARTPAFPPAASPADGSSPEARADAA